MTTETEVKEEVFSNDLLFDFSEAFARNRDVSPRRDVEGIFLDTCREFHLFGERRDKFFEAFTTYRMTVRIPEVIMARARFLPEEAPPPQRTFAKPVEQTVIKKVKPVPQISVRGQGNGYDRHMAQLPPRDRNDQD